MRHDGNSPKQSKLSPIFNSRLNNLGREQKIRALVVLRTSHDTEGAAASPSPPSRRADRQAVIAAVRRSAEQSLPVIDEILARFDGKRLTADVNALGAVPVETTATGINALAASEHVTAILEDQALSLIS